MTTLILFSIIQESASGTDEEKEERRRLKTSDIMNHMRMMCRKRENLKKTGTGMSMKKNTTTTLNKAAAANHKRNQLNLGKESRIIQENKEFGKQR